MSTPSFAGIELDRSPVSSTARMSSLVGGETRLLRRNKLMLFNAFVMPILPFLLLIPMRLNDKLDQEQTMLFVSISLALILLFVIYYNVLSAAVARRDELVLKRLRTGEASDKEILTCLALPSMAIGVILFVAMTLVAWLVLGQAPPVNPLLLAVSVLGGSLLFVLLALVTTTFTKSSEAAQITSLPIVLVSMLGVGFTSVDWMPEWGQIATRFTPMSPVSELFRLGWGGEQYDGTVVNFLDSFASSWQPLAILLGWIVLAAGCAITYFRWEPRG
nr:ABC transporter permease [Rhodococcus sp. (in: high G+C Gram-positive bacteria)]